jgi:hypothetical protein
MGQAEAWHSSGILPIGAFSETSQKFIDFVNFLTNF